MKYKIVILSAFITLVLGIVFSLSDDKNIHVLAATTGSLSFNTTTAQVNIDNNYDAQIILNTGGQAIVGATIQVLFDPNYLTLVNDPSVTVGSLPMSTINNKFISPNKVKFEQMSFSGYNGSGVAGTIKFKAKTVGTTQISYYIKDPANPNQINDCDLIISGGTDILKSVTNLSLTILSAGESTSLGSSSAVSGSGKSNSNSTGGDQSSPSGSNPTDTSLVPENQNTNAIEEQPTVIEDTSDGYWYIGLGSLGVILGAVWLFIRRSAHPF